MKDAGLARSVPPGLEPRNLSMEGTMLHVNVQGGTGAGRRILRQPRPWTHTCERVGRYADGERAHWQIIGRTLTTYSCPDCGARRDG